MSAQTVNTILADPSLCSEIEARFWRKVIIGDDDACWPCTGRHGVPRTDHVRMTIKSHLFSAHVMAWALTNGPIPEGLIVRHSCDNPPCCNPKHLLIGTYSDNAWDKISRNRMTPFSEAERRRRSEALKKRWQDPAWRQKMKDAIGGKNHYLHGNGRAQSPETVAKRVASRKGYSPTEETRRKLSEANKGRTFKHSQAAKKKISSAGLGRRHTEVAKEKIRRAALDREARKRKLKDA